MKQNIETNLKKFESIFDDTDQWGTVAQNTGEEERYQRKKRTQNKKHINDLSLELLDLYHNHQNALELNKTDTIDHKVLYQAIQDKLEEQSLRITYVKIEELLNFIAFMKQRLQYKHLLGKKQQSQPSLGAQVQQITSWLRSNYEHFIDQNSSPILSRNQGLSQQRKLRFYNNTQMSNQYTEQKQQQGRDLYRSVESSQEKLNDSKFKIQSPQKELLIKKDISVISSLNQKNIQAMNKIIEKIQVQEQSKKNQSLNKRQLNRYTSISPKQYKKVQDKDFLNQTFYTQNEDEQIENGKDYHQQTNKSKFLQNSNNFVKLPTIKDKKQQYQENPYEDIHAQQSDMRRSTLDLPKQAAQAVNIQEQSANQHHHMKAPSALMQSVDYHSLRRDITSLFDVLEHDRRSFKQFKELLNEEAFQNEQRHTIEFQLRNERLRQIKKERQEKAKVKLNKELETMITQLPRASQACRMEQMMTTKCIAEMPKAYKIKSYFDDNLQAQRRLNQLLKKD